jgi:hypothetical protein
MENGITSLSYSTEFIIWARKEKKVPHYYNYQLMKRLNEDKQMTDVWRLPAIARWEKSQGKHPTQKPLALLFGINLFDDGKSMLHPNLTSKKYGYWKSSSYMMSCRNIGYISLILSAASTDSPTIQ